VTKRRLETFITPEIFINIGFIYVPNIYSGKHDSITLIISAFVLSFVCGFVADWIYNTFAINKNKNGMSRFLFLLVTLVILVLKGYVIYKIIY